MTKPARLYQNDIDRAMKGVANAGHSRARVIMDFAKGRIEVILGETQDDSESGEWDDEDT